MLWKKTHVKACSLCERSVSIGIDEFLCPKKGVVPSSFKCRAFRYDLRKRTPERTPKLREIAHERVSL